MKTITLALSAMCILFSSFTFANPSDLLFPVAGKSNVGSFWGASRDGGKRKHEGIDIFAKKGTPVVAITDGVITTVANMPIGGKTVWLQCDGKSYTAYYAHLDKQYVHVGQVVKKGQVLGTVGNTGNARTTPSHLHFGLYTSRGAINPYPIVKNASKIKSPVTRSVPDDIASTKINKPGESSSVFPAKYIRKTITFAADQAYKYYVTTRNNVVRVDSKGYEVIGKMKNNNSDKYPYNITLANKDQLLINRAGKLLTEDGRTVGKVS